MKKIVIESFIKKSSETLINILKSFDKLPVLNSGELLGDTALVIVDMNNGFCNCGALYSPRIHDLIPTVEGLANKFAQRPEIPEIIINEAHPEDAIEFNVFPRHCVKGTVEAEVISELDNINNKIIIGKNSTNGYHSEEFRKVINDLYEKGIKKFVVVGDCTDLCILDLVITWKTHYNHMNKPIDIIVPIAGIDTYDLDITNHDGDLMNVMALYKMQLAGINIVRRID